MPSVGIVPWAHGSAPSSQHWWHKKFNNKNVPWFHLHRLFLALHLDGAAEVEPEAGVVVALLREDPVPEERGFFRA